MSDNDKTAAPPRTPRFRPNPIFDCRFDANRVFWDVDDTPTVTR